MDALDTAVLVLATVGVVGGAALVLHRELTASGRRRVGIVRDVIEVVLPIRANDYRTTLQMRVVVGKAIGKVLWRNVQYLLLNFGPFVPLSIPFVIVASQLVGGSAP